MRVVPINSIFICCITVLGAILCAIAFPASDLSNSTATLPSVINEGIGTHQSPEAIHSAFGIRAEETAFEQAGEEDLALNLSDRNYRGPKLGTCDEENKKDIVDESHNLSTGDIQKISDAIEKEIRAAPAERLNGWDQLKEMTDHVFTCIIKGFKTCNSNFLVYKPKVPEMPKFHVDKTSNPRRKIVKWMEKNAPKEIVEAMIKYSEEMITLNLDSEREKEQDLFRDPKIPKPGTPGSDKLSNKSKECAWFKFWARWGLIHKTAVRKNAEILEKEIANLGSEEKTKGREEYLLLLEKYLKKDIETAKAIYHQVDARKWQGKFWYYKDGDHWVVREWLENPNYGKKIATANIESGCSYMTKANPYNW